MKQPTFVVYEAKDGWRWRLVARNNRTIATGEAHRSARDAERACKAVVDAVMWDARRHAQGARQRVASLKEMAEKKLAKMRRKD